MLSSQPLNYLDSLLKAQKAIVMVLVAGPKVSF